MAVFSPAAMRKTPPLTLRFPLQGALNLLSLNGYDYADIQRAILAEKGDAALIQWDATAATLKALGCHNIDRVLLG